MQKLLIRDFSLQAHTEFERPISAGQAELTARADKMLEAFPYVLRTEDISILSEKKPYDYRFVFKLFNGPARRQDGIRRSLPAAGLDALPEFAVVKRLCLAGFDLTLTPFRLSQFLGLGPFFCHRRQRTQQRFGQQNALLYVQCESLFLDFIHGVHGHTVCRLKSYDKGSET